MGMIHALKVARQYIPYDPFAMNLGDNLIGSGIIELASPFRTTKAEALTLLKEGRGPRGNRSGWRG